MTDDMVIFTRTYDLLTWLLPKADGFPRTQRFVVTKRLQDAALDFQETLIEANVLPTGRSRASRLREADAELRKLRLYLRLVHRWQWLSDGQYEHVSAAVAEIGRLLGGWLRSNAAPRKGEAPQATA
jgi:23S rRNA-intervening sequence protein